jgi:hypothetical protein
MSRFQTLPSNQLAPLHDGWEWATMTVVAIDKCRFVSSAVLGYVLSAGAYTRPLFSST